MATNEVRIIGGKWKGRKLGFVGTAGLRPTLGRVRGSLFNWLSADVSGARCLDLYAGSGALGFEALSRGASELVFVERNRKAAEALKRNAELMGANAEIFTTTACRFLGQASHRWDLIFVDPPFRSHELESALGLIASRQLLAPDGLVYFERPKAEPLAFVGQTDPNQPRAEHRAWHLLKHAHAGDSQFGLLARD
jgi:16S rRNA (guanine966-N2)-methyltransferase